MVSIFKRPSHKARLPRNGHDLSHRLMFTSSCGQLLPVLYDFLDPGESIRINSKLFTRTQPLKTPAFIRSTEHIDYFFVPMCHINEYFGNQFYGIDDSSNPNNFINGDTQRNPTYNPSIYLGKFYSKFMQVSSPSQSSEDSTVFSLSSDIVDEFGVPLVSNTLRLMSLLGYSEHVTTARPAGGTDFGVPVNLNLFAAYQRIFMDYYRISDWTPNNPYSYSLTYYSKSDSNFETVLDQFSAGTHGHLLKLRYSPLKKDFFTNVLPSPLMTSLGQVNSYGQYPQSVQGYNSAILSHWGINMQWFADQKKHSVPNSSLNDKGMSSGIPFRDGVNTTQDGVEFNSIDTPFDNIYSGYNPEIEDYNNLYGAAVTASTIRTLFAIDKMKSITRRAKFHYDAQTLAHFGYSVPKGISNEVYYIGSHSSTLQIGEIVSTATTGDGDNSSVLGELAGRGIGASGKQRKIKFTAPCHGILMGIYRLVPEIDYSSYSLDKLNVINTPSLYYHPEFDKLGMQPLYLWQFYYRNNFLNGIEGNTSNPYNVPFFGWQYRYTEFKTKFNRVCGAFNYTLRDWVSTRNGSWFDSYGGSNPSFDATYFYVPPTLYDNVFAFGFLGTPFEDGYFWGVQKVPSDVTSPSVFYDTSISPVFANDPFLHSIDFKYYKVSSKSVYGLPNL